MARIVIQKINKPLRNGKPNPKCPPPEWWTELKTLLKDHEVRELPDILSWTQMKENLDWAEKIICVDSYFQHFAWLYDRQAIVIWGPSNPKHFGHDIHINLVKDKKYFKPFQFTWWEEDTLNPEAFVSPQEVLKMV